MVRPRALESWQERVVDVDHVVRVPRAKFVAEDLQESQQAYEGATHIGPH
jgi:hypothetical protein